MLLPALTISVLMAAVGLGYRWLNTLTEDTEPSGPGTNDLWPVTVDSDSEFFAVLVAKWLLPSGFPGFLVSSTGESEYRVNSSDSTRQWLTDRSIWVLGDRAMVIAKLRDWKFLAPDCSDVETGQPSDRHLVETIRDTFMTRFFSDERRHPTFIYGLEEGYCEHLTVHALTLHDDAGAERTIYFFVRRPLVDGEVIDRHLPAMVLRLLLPIVPNARVSFHRCAWSRTRLDSNLSDGGTL